MTGTPTVVVGSGKGGVGKSVVSLLLASALAAEGRRVLLLDGAQNMANLHVLLGVQARRAHGRAHRRRGRARPRWCSRWRRTSGCSRASPGNEALYAMEPADRARVHLRLSALYEAFDAVIVDAAAGIESVVRVSTMGATRLLVVTAPEPTALTDAYALMKIVNLQIPGAPDGHRGQPMPRRRRGSRRVRQAGTACERFLRRGVRVRRRPS